MKLKQSISSTGMVPTKQLSSANLKAKNKSYSEEEKEL
jgi:hypothetical protein